MKKPGHTAALAIDPADLETTSAPALTSGQVASCWRPLTLDELRIRIGNFVSTDKELTNATSRLLPTDAPFFLTSLSAP